MMKNLKKALSLTLALALSLSLALPASATEVEDSPYIEFSSKPVQCVELTLNNFYDEDNVYSPVWIFPENATYTVTAMPEGGSIRIFGMYCSEEQAWDFGLWDEYWVEDGYNSLDGGPRSSNIDDMNNGVLVYCAFGPDGEIIEEIDFCSQSVLDALIAAGALSATPITEPEQPAEPAEPEQPAEPKDTSVTVGGKAVEWTDAKPFIDANDRTMVPLRAVADAMGLKVVWYTAERQAAFTNGSKVIYFPIDNTTALTTGGGSVQMDTAAVIANDRTYAPIRYLAEFFGYEVGWDGATSTVTITKGNREGFICGETEPHQWQAANYQAPETCSVCGATQGSALTPDFVTYGIKTDVKVGEHYKVRTICYDNRDAMTEGDFTVLDYSVIKSDDTHAAKDGYEWRVATFQLIFGDENAWNYGYSYATAYEGYYDIRLNDDSSVYTDDNNSTRTVNYYGEDMETYLRRDILSNDVEEGIGARITYRLSYQVPVGYDGFVSGVSGRDTAELPDGYINEHYSPDNYFLFRFS